ncbi:hypothetical protein ACE38V_06455 [Cytobacillus sp. Hz8]|uniref:hypothetical protein n=1 Tax=Cytobacillus sp. Hz8 TaxID=3347168 RepID=UPI0035DBA7FB
MTKLTFYISELLDDNSTLSDFENKIADFCDLLEYIVNNNDVINVPEHFFESKIVGKITIAEYLFEPQYASDYRELLFEYIRQYKRVNILYPDLYVLLDEKNNQSYKAIVGMLENKYINEDSLYVNDKTMILSPYRFYLGQLQSLEEFKIEFSHCFPNLIFHERVKQTLNAFNDIINHSKELIRHLSILNDFAKELYVEIGGASDEIYARLKSEFNIISSGRGANEGLDKFKCDFYNKNKELESVRCNPHTKLYYAHSDYRIYFNWGRDSIGNGEILIGHIGTHWND